MKDMSQHRSAMLQIILCGFLGVFGVHCDSPTNPSEIQVSYEHYRAVWSPDSSTIVFIARINNTQGIYAVDTLGSNLRLVYGGDTGGPTWSSDSKWLAFSQGLNIWKVKATGDSLRQLTNGGGDVRPSWSRDGKTIAFVRTGISVIDVATDSIRSLTGIGDYPSWHPNGEEIFMQVTSGGGTIASFYAVHRDSGTNRLVFTISAGGVCSFSSISPSGQELLFSLTPFTGVTQIWKVDMVANSSQQLTEDGGDFATWSPDGSKIVYTRITFGDGALWIMNRDGTGKRRLTSPPGIAAKSNFKVPD